MTDESVPVGELESIELPKHIQRQLARAQEKARRRGQTLTPIANGYAATDTRGNLYAKQHGGLIRITVTEDGKPMRMKKWDKARKKAAKRERARLRKANAR